MSCLKAISEIKIQLSAIEFLDVKTPSVLFLYLIWSVFNLLTVRLNNLNLKGIFNQFLPFSTHVKTALLT